MSWCVRLLLHQDLLERPARPEGNRHGPEDEIPVCHQSGSQAHGDTQAAGAQRHWHQAGEGEWAGLPAELPGLLYQEWKAGLCGHTGQVRLPRHNAVLLSVRMRRRGDFVCNDSSLLFGVRFIVMTHNSNRPTQPTKRKWPVPIGCSSRMLILVKCCPAWWHRLVCRPADNNQRALRALCLWLVWACVTEKATVTGVLVLLSETLTNAVILRTECTQADIDWMRRHRKVYLHHSAPVF